MGRIVCVFICGFFSVLPEFPLNANICGSCRVHRLGRGFKGRKSWSFPYCKYIEDPPKITMSVLPDTKQLTDEKALQDEKLNQTVRFNWDLFVSLITNAWSSMFKRTQISSSWCSFSLALRKNQIKFLHHCCSKLSPLEDLYLPPKFTGV